MSWLTKLCLVIGGYIAACLLAYGAVYVNGLFIQDPSQASAGMSAFGDSILFLGAFGFLAIFPTGLALYFLLRKFLKRKA
ncbi:MAG: hypothetical protein H7Y59_15260 [Anaerolineales bacterium]|nr:hypothetical protein [Anaerolineales bacterium]